MMRKHLKLMSFALLSAALLISCYPKEKNLYYSDLDVAITNYDENFVANTGFDKVEHVFLLDTVMSIVAEGETAKGTYDKVILRTTKDNLMDIFGDKLTIVSDSNDVPAGVTPDLVVTIAVMETDYYNYWSYPWYNYWGYYGWGWYYKSGALKSTNETDEANYYYNPWYPWYPSGGVSYAYSIGSVNIDMINYKDAKPSEDFLPVAWTGIINGMRSNNGGNETTRIENQINQAFSAVQSPYLY